MTKGTYYMMLCLTVLISGTARVESEIEQPKPVKSFAEKIISADVEVRKEAIETTLKERKQLVNTLADIVNQKNADKYPWKVRAGAAYLLGQLRAVEGVPALSSALGKILPAAEAERKFGFSRLLPPYLSPLAVVSALGKIGRPAVPAMIKNIETSDDRMLRLSSLDVLNHVLGGKRRTLELLEKLQVRAGADEKKTERIKAAIKRVQKRYKEDEEPLY